MLVEILFHNKRLLEHRKTEVKYLSPRPDAAPLVHERALEIIGVMRLQGKTALDLGTGEGAFAEALLRRGASFVVCVDKDPSRFKLKSNPFTSLIVTDLDYGLPFRDSAFDIVTAIEVIEHLFNIGLFVREIHRVLKSNGIFLMTTPNVEHILSRLYFLFTGRLWQFFKGSEWKHVTG